MIFFWTLTFSSWSRCMMQGSTLGKHAWSFLLFTHKNHFTIDTRLSSSSSHYSLTHTCLNILTGSLSPYLCLPLSNCEKNLKSAEVQGLPRPWWCKVTKWTDSSWCCTEEHQCWGQKSNLLTLWQTLSSLNFFKIKKSGLRLFSIRFLVPILDSGTGKHENIFS